MYKAKITVFLIVGLVSISIISKSQSTSSPFTSRGIGDINKPALSHNQAMGGLGISNGSYWHLNNINPALLTYNSLTVFSAGLNLEQRNISNDLTTESNSGGSLSYLATAFPIIPTKWTTSVGLAPYSNVGYNFSLDNQSIPNAPDSVSTIITEEGSGGFTQFYWSNGVALHKNLSLGLKITYLFSSIETEYRNQLVNVDDQVPFTPAVKNRLSASDFKFQGSFAFKKDSIFNNRIQLKTGATFDLASDIDATLLESTELQLGANRYAIDTLSNNENGTVSLPWALGVGFSFNNNTKWAAGIDFTYQPWSEYKNFEGSNENFEDTYSFAIGGEYTPDPSSVSSYFNRVTYRIGFSYETTPFTINGKQANDFGINFGWSLPVSRFSSLDMAFKYGRRGKISDTLIEEEYYGFTLGVTFNDQWFIKRKYD